MTTKPLVFAYNAAFIFTTMLIVYLFRKENFLAYIWVAFWLFLGIVNGVLLLNRVTPFTGPDLHLITDALKIANKYLPFAGVVAVCILFWDCGSDSSDHPDKIAEVQRQAEI